MRLAELCAGSAAVSMAWMGQRTPLGWQGGKRAFANSILHAAGLAPLGALRTGGEVVLCEPGPWGDAWRLWCEHGTSHTASRLLAWNTADPANLWGMLSAAPTPADPFDRVLVWCVLQFWSFGSKPVIDVGGRWRTHGFHEEGAYRSEIARAKREQGRPKYRMGRDQRLSILAARLAALDLSRIRAVYRSIAEVPIYPGAITYLDPPYVGTTCAYGHTMSRPMVLDVVIARAKAGELVMVSEAEPLDLLGWSALKLPSPRGRGRNNFTAQREEWLTVCPALGAKLRPAASALNLPGFS